MRIITTREFRQEAKAFFELAETERIAVKRGAKYVHLLVADAPDKAFLSADWVKDFLAIPDEYRVNPFDISPSGDLFYADCRNVAYVDQAVKQAKKGKFRELTPEFKEGLFGDLSHEQI